MRKLILALTLAVSLFVFASLSFAATTDVSIRLEQPQSPTNNNNFNINFVALDIPGRPVSVQCFKKGPSDGGFSQFGPTQNLTSGGNSSNCAVTSSLMSANGTYQFYATAQADGDTATSLTVTVDYNTSGPGTPTNYGKSQPSSCQYKISFKTADDGGKTVRVDIYRSDSTSFSLDAGTKIGEVAIGSNLDGSFTDTVPDCSKTYYYAIRAFDSAGNGSGVVGDSVIKIITTTTASPAPAEAIPVTPGVGGAILGETTQAEGAAPAEPTEGEVMGETTPSAVTPEVSPAAVSQLWQGLTGGQKLGLILGLLALLGVAGYLYSQSRRQ